MSDKNIKASHDKSEWHFHPDLPIGNNPLFEWPWSLSKILAYHKDYWLTLSEVSFFFLLAIAGWGFHQSYLSHEPDLLGTGGTLLANSWFYQTHEPILIAHADNLCLFCQWTNG